MNKNICIAINNKVVNKIKEGDSYLWKSLATDFTNVELSLEEFAESINSGYAYCAQHTEERNQDNFLRTNVMSVDIDGGMTVKQALDHDFFRSYGAILYTTVSHTAEHHRFRLIFVTEQVIQNAAKARLAITGLIRKFDGDKSCSDACRAFFGSSDSDPIILGNTIPDEVLNNLIADGKANKDNTTTLQNGILNPSPSGEKATKFLDYDEMVMVAGSKRFAYVESLPPTTSIHCPFHSDKNASAFVTQNKQGVIGVVCRSCATTFWPKPNSQQTNFYNFLSYEQYVLSKKYTQPLSITSGRNKILETISDNVVNTLEFNKQYIPLDIPLHTGVTCMRSPKGSGKTAWLSHIVSQCKSEAKKVLLIGHRRSLIRGIALRLGLTSYLDQEEDGHYVEPTDHYAVCVDSVGKRLKPDIHKYDVVIIDESEQVFTHLTSETIQKKRRIIYEKMFFYLRYAESVILADADLDIITVSTVSNMVKLGTSYNFYLNTYKECGKQIEIYTSHDFLMMDLFGNIANGGHFYVATNAKNQADIIFSLIKDEFPSIKALLVTSDTTSHHEVQTFLDDVTGEILNYDVIVASPTMGTGIDITFLNNEEKIKGVYGFFKTNINSHFDIDQQLSRVRHPAFIKVWISPISYNQEENIEKIKAEMKNSEKVNDAMLAYDCHGVEKIDHRYLDLYCVTTSVGRGSKNQIFRNLLNLREYNGWAVNYVHAGKADLTLMQEMTNRKKEQINEETTNATVNANVISDDDYQKLAERSKNAFVSAADKYSMRRYEIESFYKIPITAEIIELDNGGKYREQIKMLECYLSPLPVLIYKSKNEKRRHVFLPDQKLLPGKKYYIHQLLKAAFISSNTQPIDHTTRLSQESLFDFARCFRKYEGSIKEQFHIETPKDLANKSISALQKILEIIGLKTTDAVRVKQKRLYYVDKGSIDTAMEVINIRREFAIRKAEIGKTTIKPKTKHLRKENWRLDKELVAEGIMGGQHEEIIVNPSAFHEKWSVSEFNADDEIERALITKPVKPITSLLGF
jgi:hypothetical protein